MILKLKKNNKNNKKELSFCLSVNYEDMEEEAGKNEPRRIRGFVEAVDNGKKTFIIDFNIGVFRGQTLWQMSADHDGLNMLNWITEKDFPEEVKQCIRKHIEDRFGIESPEVGAGWDGW